MPRRTDRYKSPYGRRERVEKTPGADQADDDDFSWGFDDPVKAYDAAMESIFGAKKRKVRKPCRGKGDPHLRAFRREMLQKALTAKSHRIDTRTHD